MTLLKRFKEDRVFKTSGFLWIMSNRFFFFFFSCQTPFFLINRSFYLSIYWWGRLKLQPEHVCTLLQKVSPSTVRCGWVSVRLGVGVTHVSSNPYIRSKRKPRFGSEIREKYWDTRDCKLSSGTPFSNDELAQWFQRTMILTHTWVNVVLKESYGFGREKNFFYRSLKICPFCTRSRKFVEHSPIFCLTLYLYHIRFCWIDF